MHSSQTSYTRAYKSYKTVHKPGVLTNYCHEPLGKFFAPYHNFTHALQITVPLPGSTTSLVCFSKATFANPVKSQLRLWDPRRVSNKRYGPENDPNVSNAPLVPGMSGSSYTIAV